jgi:hypothetical protein
MVEMALREGRKDGKEDGILMNYSFNDNDEDDDRR